MSIRIEQPVDIEKIWNINAEAFDTVAEANLVNALRGSGIPYIALVYEENHELVGHIFFSPVELSGDTSDIRIMGLAPMAVASKFRNKGLGSALVKAGIEQCISEGFDAIVVLGHPNYYPKFGFVPSVRYGIKSEYDVPDEAFMVLELRKNSLAEKQGTIKYHGAFNTL